MSDPSTQDEAQRPISERYADLAQKSALQAEAALRRAHTASDSEDPRATKKARREAEDWCEQAVNDANRAHGALAAESGQFEVRQTRAEEAVTAATKAREAAADVYRKLKGS